MIKKKRWRYYCEYCKKSGGSSFHMERHEKGCTKNPDRHCGFCHLAGENQTPIDELKEIILKHIRKSVEYNSIPFISLNDYIIDEQKCLDELRDKTYNCPSCMLAAIRQTEKLKHTQGIEFNFKEESKEWFSEYDNANASEDYGYY